MDKLWCVSFGSYSYGGKIYRCFDGLNENQLFSVKYKLCNVTILPSYNSFKNHFEGPLAYNGQNGNSVIATASLDCPLRHYAGLGSMAGHLSRELRNASRHHVPQPQPDH